MSPKNITRTRLLIVTLGILTATAASSSATIVYSGLLGPGGAGIAIPTNFEGIYLTFDTGATSEPSADLDSVGSNSYTIGYTAPSSWDINFFFGGIGMAYSPTFQPFVDDSVTNRAQILNVAQGTQISTEAATRTLGLGVDDQVYGVSGRSNGGAGSSHFDTPSVDANPAYSSFTTGQQGYLAFVLNPGEAEEQYGWASVTLANDGTAGAIHEFAFSDEASFTVSQIPEPGVPALIGLFAVLGILRRRHR